MERRKIRQEEEKEREKKKKDLKRSFRKQKKDKFKTAFTKLTVTKIIIIIIIIVTPIIILFAYNYYIAGKKTNYSFFTEGDEVHGTILANNELNLTYILSKISFASTAQYMSMEITDNYPYSNTLYQATLQQSAPSVLAIPYDLHPNNHHAEIGDCYADFTVGFIHNVPDLLYVLKSSGSVVYPSVLEWNYRLNETDLDTLISDQNNFFFDPVITVEPGNRQLYLNNPTEIHVIVNLTAGYYNSIGFSEISMSFVNSNNITFSNPKILIGGLETSTNQYTFISRRQSIGAFTSMFLEFNVTVNSTQSFTNKNILSSGSIFFQYGAKLLQDIYPTKGFSSIKASLLGIPNQEQLEAFVYQIGLKYTNFVIDTPLNFNCTV